MDEPGLSDFSTLRSAMGWQPERLVFVSFDVLYLDGADLRPRPLIERRAELEKLIDGASAPLHIAGSGHAFYEAIDRMGIEGMVLKHASAPYRSGRTESWLKVKCYEESDCEVAPAA